MRSPFAAVLILLAIAVSHAQSYVPEKNNPRIQIKPQAALKAYAFNLKDVKMLDGPFKRAMDLDAAYLLELDPDRLLHRFRLHAGLEPKGEIYGGWEKESLSGHSLGHYLTAVALLYATHNDPELKKRSDYIVSELALCQDARKTGYVGAIPKEDTLWAQVARGEIKSAGFDLNGIWSPWYTVHKVMAGLFDAYLYTGNEQAKEVLSKMADWTGDELKNLNDEQLQKMLACEYGGMNDILVNTYAITGSKKYLATSHLFHDRAVLGPLSEQVDNLQGKHSNTQIPKIIGCASRFELTGNEGDKAISTFFWDAVVNHHTYAIGGNSDSEYLGAPDKLNEYLSDNTAETCNTYNMLKLTRHLITWRPSNELADFYERALYNHILASQHPESGMMCYFVPLRRGARKNYSNKLNSFWCCVGSGMENHVKYGEGIYYEGTDQSLFVNLFIPSQLNWQSKGVLIRQETSFPQSNQTTLVIDTKKPTTATIRIRNPWWSKDQVFVRVNGQELKPTKDEFGYFAIPRQWKNLDRIEITFDLALHHESMPDNPNRVALMYGPIVLAGELGQEEPDPVYGIPVLLTDNRNVSDWLKPVDPAELRYETRGVGTPRDITLRPFYDMHDQRYSVYWDFFTPTEWEQKKADYEADKLKKKEIDERTIDIIALGQMQSERDHNVQSEKSYAGEANTRHWRDARENGFFSFEAKVDPNAENILRCTYWGSDGGGKLLFDIVVEGTVIGTQEVRQNFPNTFFDIEYPIPSDLIKGKDRIHVRFQPRGEKRVARTFGARVLRARQ
ncbi:MAG: beta-L-arabinofuranosidase domain-containing protein [Cyclobacteriaceae bacterium]